MKFATLFALAISSAAFAAPIPWKETFKLPEGMTYRARGAGYDCGTFGNVYVDAPSEFRPHVIQFRQLAADKDLNKFLIEATFAGTDSFQCTIGLYLDRNRDDKTLDFTNSDMVSHGDVYECAAGREFLESRMQHVAYEASKRGIRYIATQIQTKDAAEVCESGVIRMVFDRRFTE